MRTIPLLVVSLLGVAVLVPIAADADQSPGGEFAVGSALNTDRQAAYTARLPDGRIAVFGGHGDGWSTPATAEVSTVPGAWTELAMLGPHDLGAGCVLSDGRVLLAGGSRENGIVPGYRTAEVFDPVAGTFTATGSMNDARGGAAAALLTSGKVLVVGSWYDLITAAVGEVYDPVTGSFSVTAQLNHPRAYPLVVPLGENRALVIGGTEPYGGSVTAVEVYDADANTFTVVQDELFTGDDGWSPFGATETAHDIAFHRLHDGRCLFLCNRYEGGIYTYRFFTVDPSTEQIAELVTDPPLPQADGSGGWYVGPLVSPDGRRAHVLQFVTMTDWRLLTLDVVTGTLAVPDTTWTVPNGQFPAPASLAVLTDGRLLFAGGRMTTGGGNSVSSGDTLVITPDGPPSVDPPQPPDNLTLAPLWMDRISVTWSDHAFDENGFRVERRLPGEEFEPIGTVGPDVTHHTDDTALPATSYEYRVCAYNAHGDSAFTAPAAVETPGGKLKLSRRTLNFGRVRVGEFKTKLLKIKNKDKQFPAMIDLRMPPNLPFRFVEGEGLIVVPPKGKMKIPVEFRPTEPGKVKETTGYEATSRDMDKLAELLLKLKGRGK